MLDVGEEDVPDDGDDVDIEDPEGLRNIPEVDVLGRRPDHPVELKYGKHVALAGQPCDFPGLLGHCPAVLSYFL